MTSSGKSESSSAVSLLLLLLSFRTLQPCAWLRLFQSKFTHARTVWSHPTQLQFMTDGRGHIHSEQQWCRWTVCMCVCISVCGCGLVVLSSRAKHCFTKASELPNVGAAACVFIYEFPVAHLVFPWNDYFNQPVKRWSSLLFIIPYWTVHWSVSGLRSAIMQMSVPRWKCVSACRCVWVEWVWEEWMIGAFSCNCFCCDYFFMMSVSPLRSNDRKWSKCQLAIKTRCIIFYSLNICFLCKLMNAKV